MPYLVVPCSSDASRKRRRLDLEARLPGFESWLCHLLAPWPCKLFNFSGCPYPHLPDGINTSACIRAAVETAYDTKWVLGACPPPRCQGCAGHSPFTITLDLLNVFFSDEGLEAQKVTRSAQGHPAPEW